MRFKIVKLLLIIISAVFCLSQPLIADDLGSSPKSKQPDLIALVKQLGDERFASRESATEELIEIGLPAITALEAGLKSPDREIRYRSERIIHAVKRTDFQRQLAAFAANLDDANEINLPGWSQFRQILGEDHNARELFVEMQRAESDMIVNSMDNPDAAGDAIGARCLQIQQAMRFGRTQLPLGSIATLLFLAADDRIKFTPQSNSALYSFCYQASFQNAIQQGDKKPMLRKLLGKWVMRSESWTAYQGLNLAMRYDLKEGLIPAERILNEGANRGNPAHITQYAILTIAKMGEQKHIKLLKKYLDDTTRTSSRRVNKVTFETQVRDVALASIMHLSKEDPKKFGFTQIQRNSQMVFSTSTLGFKNDTERKAVFEKWKAFEEKQEASEAKPETKSE